MTKSEMIDAIAQDAQITKTEAGNALNSFMDNIIKALKKKNGTVKLIGFGTFIKQRRKARTGSNPQTGKPLKIKAKNFVKFRAGKKLKEAI